MWEAYLKISESDGWKSEYRSVSKLLRYLRHRRSGSERSREEYCFTLYSFCRFTGKTPDELVALSKAEVEEFFYHKREGRCSLRTAIGLISKLATFFRENGFKGDREPDVGNLYQHLNTCFRTWPEYVPTLEEAQKMADVAGSLRNRTIILFLLSTGLRNAALRALTYGDLKEELEKGMENLLIKIRPEMKERVPGACKWGTPYYTFTSKEATEALRLYLEERRRKYGEIRDADPLFSSEYNRLPCSKRNKKPLIGRGLQVIVKNAARKAGIKQWKWVTPQCLRKTYEHILRSPRTDGTRLDAKTQEKLMGHRLPGSQEACYRISEEELRAEYSKLIFTPQAKDKIEAMKVITEFLGINISQIANLKGEKTGNPILEKLLEALQNTVKQGKYRNEVPYNRVKTDPPPICKHSKQSAITRNQNQTKQTSLLPADDPAMEKSLTKNTQNATSTETNVQNSVKGKEAKLDDFLYS